MEGKKRLDILKQLSKIILEEIELAEKLITLCEKDTRLGFHADAEGYKYFPGKIKWRIQQLQYVLDNEVPEFKKIIRENKPLYPEYTGKKPEGTVYQAIRSDGSLYPEPDLNQGNEGIRYDWHHLNYGQERSSVWGTISYDSNALFVILLDSAYAENESKKDYYSCQFSSLNIRLESNRLFPSKNLHVSLKAETRGSGARVLKTRESDLWYSVIRIPFAQVGLNPELLHPVRIDLNVQMKSGERYTGRSYHPLTPRLLLGTDNPADLDWLIFSN